MLCLDNSWSEVVAFQTVMQTELIKVKFNYEQRNMEDST